MRFRENVRCDICSKRTTAFKDRDSRPFYFCKACIKDGVECYKSMLADEKKEEVLQ